MAWLNISTTLQRIADQRRDTVTQNDHIEANGETDLASVIEATVIIGSIIAIYLYSWVCEVRRQRRYNQILDDFDRDLQEAARRERERQHFGGVINPRPRPLNVGDLQADQPDHEHQD